MFYTEVWEYEGYKLVTRPDSPNYFIYWRPSTVDGRPGRVRRENTRVDGEATQRRANQQLG